MNIGPMGTAPRADWPGSDNKLRIEPGNHPRFDRRRNARMVATAYRSAHIGDSRSGTVTGQSGECGWSYVRGRAEAENGNKDETQEEETDGEAATLSE